MLTSLKTLNYIHSIEVDGHADFIKWFDVDCEYRVVEDKYKPFVVFKYVKGEITMKNKKLLKYFTEKILPILDEIEFNDTEHEADFNGFNVYYDDNQLNKCEVEVDYKTKKRVK